MRFFVAILLCSFGLTNCVNYKGIKSNGPRPYNAATLSVQHSYSSSNTNTHSYPAAWWNRFHDSQLNEFIMIALADSPTLSVALNRIQLAQHIVEGANSSLWPSASFDTSIARERLTANSIYPPPFAGAVVSEGNMALNFNYEIDWWGKNRQTLAARISEKRAAEADFVASRLIISTSVANAYFQLQSNLAQLKIAESIVRQRHALLKIIQLRTNRGIVSDIPLSRTLADAQNADLSILRSKQNVEISKHQLAALIGKNPFTTSISVKPLVYKKDYLSLPPNIPANLLARRPDIYASKWRVEAAAHEVNASKAKFFPNINLSAFLSYQTIGLDRFFKSSSRDNAIKGALDLPIFDANARRADLKTQYAEYDIAVGQYNDAIITALREVADEISALHYLHLQQEMQNNVLKTTQKNYNLLKSRYHSGITDYTQVLNTEGTLLNQQKIQIQLQAKHVLTMVGMIKALGGDCTIEG